MQYNNKKNFQHYKEGNHMQDELQIMLKSYYYIRQEILNAIYWQNRIFITLTTIISILPGPGITETKLLKISVIIIP